MSIKFGVEYKSESSYRLLMHFLGMSFKLPDPFDKRRDEKAIARRMAEIRDQVANLLQDGWEVYTVDEVRVEHEAETRRMWLPKGKRTKLYVDRKKASRSFFGALSRTLVWTAHPFMVLGCNRRFPRCQNKSLQW